MRATSAALRLPSWPTLLIAFLLVSLAGCASVDLGDRGLSGTWVPVAADMGGQAIPIESFAGNQLRLTAEHYAFGEDRGTYWVVSPGPPARMNLHGDAGPNADRIIPAIYRLSADRLTIAYQLGIGAAPTDFASTPGSQVLVVHYRRPMR